MSDQDLEDNNSTAGVEDDDAAAPVDILDTSVPTWRAHPDGRTREAWREVVRTRSAIAAPAAGDMSLAEERPAASSMARRLTVPPCMQDLAVDQKKTTRMDLIVLFFVVVCMCHIFVYVAVWDYL